MAVERISIYLKAIVDQGLSKEEMLSRLDAIVAAEYELPKSCRNKEFIEACLDLQWFLMKGEHYRSRKEEASEKLAYVLDKHTQSGEREHHRAQRILCRRIAVIASCVILLMVLPFAGQTFLSREWIEGESVRNGEIYRLNGEEVDPHLVEKAIADVDNEELILSTTDAAMIAKIPGVQDIQMHYVPEGWERSEYLYMNVDGMITYTESFLNTNNKKQNLTYMCMVFPDVESVENQVQQNETGDVFEVNGIVVYVSQNFEMLVAVWNEGLTNRTLYGPIDHTQMELMIASIGGNNREI